MPRVPIMKIDPLFYYCRLNGNNTILGRCELPVSLRADDKRSGGRHLLIQKFTHMQKTAQTKTTQTVSKIFLVLLSLSLLTTNAFAVATVTAGSASASADTAADATVPSFTTVSTITIAESANNTFSQASTAYTLTLTTPSGWTFDTGGVAPSVAKNGGGSDIVGNPAINRINNTTITVLFTNDAALGAKDTLTITGIRVQPTTGVGLSSANVTIVSSGTVSGGFSTTNVATLTKTGGAAKVMTFGVQPSDANVTLAITPAVTVQLQDKFGNVSSSASAVTMAIGTNPGGGVLGGTTNVNAVSGTATFDDLSINKSGAGYTLTASSAGLTGIVSAAFSVTSDPDLPGAQANIEIIPAGSYVIPMDNTNQSIVAPFNLKAYGLVNQILQNNIPVKWAIRSGKAKDAADFTASAFRISPSVTATASVSFAGGPFIIHRDNTNAVRALITAFGNNVAVYQLVTNTPMDIRYNLGFRPTVAINTVNGTIHGNLLTFAGITNFTYIADASILPNSCYTLFMEPHTGNTNGVPTVKAYLQSGGNFLAECLAIDTYENADAGHLQVQVASGDGITSGNIGNTLSYSNADLAFGQFVGTIEPAPGGSHQDWINNGSFMNNGHIILDNATGGSVPPPHFAATAAKLYNGPGGNVFYLGGHNYGAGGTDITLINGQRMVLNTVFIPQSRPLCGFNFVVDLAVSKSGAASVVSGQNLTYTITVTNANLGVIATNVVTTDTLPPGVSFVSASGGGTTNGSGVVTWPTIANLTNGSTISYTLTVKTLIRGSLTNFANATSPNPDSNPTNNTSPPVITQVLNNPPVATNDNYTLTGGSVLTVPQLSGVVSNDFDFDGDTLTATIVSNPTNGTIVLNGNGSFTYTQTNSAANNDTFTYRVNDGTTNSGVATVFITIIKAPPVITCVTNKMVECGSAWTFDVPAATVSCGTNAVIAVVSTSTNFSGSCGNTFSATRTWSATDVCGNSNTCSQTVTVADTIGPVITCPADVIVPVFSQVPVPDPSTATATDNCDTPTKSFVGDTAVTNGSTVTIIRTYAATDACGNSNTCSQTITVTPSADVSISKSGNASVVAGQNLSYTIVVSNSGPSTATNVVASDPLPAGTSFVSATGSGTTNGSGLVSWPAIASLANGGTVSYTLVVSTPASGTLTNVASVTTPTPDPTPTNNMTPPVITIIIVTATPTADVVVMKFGETNILAGGSLTYTIAVTNLGPSTATNVVVTDTLPSIVAFQSASSGGTTNSSGNVIWPVIATLANGGFTNYTITVSAPLATSKFTNIVSATSTTTDTNLANNNGLADGSQVKTTVIIPTFDILAGSAILNPQTGLFEETVFVTNTTPVAIPGLRLTVGGLRSGVSLYNATGTNANKPYVQYNFPLDPGQVVRFRLEFFVLDRLPFTNTLTAESVVAVATGTNNSSSFITIKRAFMDVRIGGEARFVIEFESVIGKTYTIIYSDDTMTWKVAVPSIKAVATRTQWYDDGPPKTDSKPKTVPSRSYRVIVAP